MSGSGFTNDVMHAENVDFSGNFPVSATVTTNGQLLIGSTASPNIKVGNITSPNGTLTIGYSSPNITVDLTGGSTGVDSFAMQTGTSPVLPTAAGLVTFNGSVVAAGTNPVRTDGTGPNTMAVEVQISQALAATDITKIGLSNFDSAAFDVDANGFVQLNGGGIAATSFDVQANTVPGTDPVVPTSAGVVTVNGAAVANHSVVLETRSRAANAYNIEVQYGTSAAATDATKSGVAHFNSAQFTVDANGFVSSSGTGILNTLTGNTGGAISPAAGNINTVGTGSITISGAASTLTTQLSGLTNHNVLVGAGTATITNVAPSATSGVPFISQGASADPAFGTAVVAGGGTGVTSTTAYGVICGGTTSTNPFQSIASVGTSGQVLTSNGAAALPTFQSISATSAFTQVAIQVFTSTGANTYTPTTGMKYCIVEVQGAGGGGGGVQTAGVAQAAGAGGGAGAYARGVFSAATVGASQTATVGTGGTAGANTGGTGGTGGTSSFGSLISCTGGVGGAGRNGDVTCGITDGGVGGTASGSGVSFSCTGYKGSPGYWANLGAGGLFSIPGAGALSRLGTGAIYTPTNTGIATAGSNGIQGGGGSGANVSGGANQQAGGVGGNGIIVVTEFISV